MANGNQTKIAVLVECSRGYGRGLLRGIASYARSHTDWSVYRHEQALGDSIPSWFRKWDGDAIIARVESQRLADEIARRNLPTVDLRGLFTIPNVPVVATNDLAVVQLACDHLHQRGLRTFAYCGFSGADYSDCRQSLTIDYLASLGITPFAMNCRHGRSADTTAIEAEGLLHQQELGQFLRTLPKPAGVITCNDVRAAQVLDACRQSEIESPDEVAVIGVDNDELICEMTTPPLTSVANATHRIGYHACEILAEMLVGKSPPNLRITINPLGVVERRSTETFANDDADICAALRFIRLHACDGISVKDVAEAICISRCALDRRFARAVGKSVKSEINRVRLSRVKQLLVDTEYKMSVIARLTGFSHLEYLSTMFKHHFGMTPGQFRASHHGQTAGIEC